MAGRVNQREHADVFKGAKEPIIGDERVSIAFESIRRCRHVNAPSLNLYCVICNRLDTIVPVDETQHGNGEAMDDNGEDHEKINNCRGLVDARLEGAFYLAHIPGPRTSANAFS